MSAAWETVVGLEVHVQLLTKTKMFCGCRTNYGDPPNTNVCPCCLGLPGALPVPNEQAVRLAVRAAFALECSVHARSMFARKNYFYPDLPKGYQISQFDEPLATGGRLEIVSPERGPLTVGITRLHLEEDAGKSFHDRYPGMTAVDFNRSGVPLIEIVSEPDLRSPAEARAYLTALKQILRWLGVSDCNMEEGSLRVDANLSIRRPGDPLGTRTEVKNMNSFSGVERALTIERERQITVVEGGGIIEQRTLKFDAAKGEVRVMRSKEESHDYRYFPEPDLPPLVLKAEWLKAEKDGLPELPASKRKRLVAEDGLSDYDAAVVTSYAALDTAYVEIKSSDVSPKTAANWLLNDVLSLTGDPDQGLPVTAAQVLEAIRLVEAKQISRQAAKVVLKEMARTGDQASTVVERLGFALVDDATTIAFWVTATLAAHPAEVARYKGGEQKLMGFFTGQVMKRSKGRADPKVVGATLAEELKRMEPGGPA